MQTDDLKTEIDQLIAELGSQAHIAKPAVEQAVLERIRALLDATRDQRTGAARDIWTVYLPYAADLCFRLSKLEEGWGEALDYFASENAQFWLDSASALLEEGDLPGVNAAIGQVLPASKMLKQDMIARVEFLLQALEMALEISNKKHAIQLYQEAEKLYRKQLAGGERYAGSPWLRRINKIGQQISRYQEQLRRYYHHAETVIVSIEADSENDLQRVLDYLQESLVGKVKITRRPKEMDAGEKTAFRARVKISLE